MDIDEDRTPRPGTTAAGGKRGKQKGRSITVVARFRPENAQEIANGGESVVHYHPNGETVDFRVDSRLVSNLGDDKETHQFRFDKIFPSYATQHDMWNFVGSSVVDGIFDGVNASILAYGQTGSGKTYTMMGQLDPKTSAVVDNPGLIPRIFTGIFQRCEDMPSHLVSVEINFVELYMERLYDLLSDAAFNRTGAPRGGGWTIVGDVDETGRCEVQGSGGTIYISNCRTAIVRDCNAAMDVIHRGLKVRATAATGSNLQSSRSHAIVLVTLRTKDQYTLQESTAQLYLVDLAGSEKVAKTEAVGLRLDEAKSINVSLHQLGNVITALSLRQTSRKHAQLHVPFRNSKLTRLLENSLGGNALTYVCLTVSPSSFNDAESLSTLRFGAKAKLVTTKPTRNIQRSAEELELLLERAHAEIADLKMQMTLMRRQAASDGGAASPGNVVSLKLNSASPNGRPSTSARGGASGGAATTYFGNLIRANEAELSRLVSATLTCPITGQLFRNPVMCLDGHTYERSAIQSHLISHDMRSPVTGEQVQMQLLVPNQLVRCLLTMCHDRKLLEVAGGGAPLSIFEVPDILGIILDFVPPEQTLGHARVCNNFARAAYDKYRWRPLIEQMLRTASKIERDKIMSSTLPAHKVYLLLSYGCKGTLASVADRVQALQYMNVSSVALYSATIRGGKRR